MKRRDLTLAECWVLVKKLKPVEIQHTIEQFYKNHAIENSDPSIMPSPLTMVPDAPKTVELDSLIPCLTKVMQYLMTKCVECEECCEDYNEDDVKEEKKRQLPPIMSGGGCYGCYAHLHELADSNTSCYCTVQPDDPMCAEDPYYIPDDVSHVVIPQWLIDKCEGKK